MADVKLEEIIEQIKEQVDINEQLFYNLDGKFVNLSHYQAKFILEYINKKEKNNIMINIKEIIDLLHARIYVNQDEGKPTNYASFDKHVGVLLTADEAQAILNYIKKNEMKSEN